jgi:hypothetical protein
MTYGNFTLDGVCRAFGLTIRRAHLFASVQSLDLPPWLQDALDKGLPLALGSEKARSEFIIVPILLTSRELAHDSVSIYSGQRLDVDPDSGLIGECDFIITATPPLPLIQAPIVCIIAAQENDIEAGPGQCVAQMLGALRLNQRDATGIETIFGCVTTGEIWQFLKLEQNDIIIDQERYYIDNIRTILGVLQVIFAQYAPQPATM